MLRPIVHIGRDKPGHSQMAHALARSRYEKHRCYPNLVLLHSVSRAHLWADDQILGRTTLPPPGRK
ncbi:MAG TPA: hypothetical protein VD767_07690, partial [Thermomicrobiales bacterium]|nr:hypothetical protein [Thermomicrobiales bacterium]